MNKYLKYFRLKYGFLLFVYFSISLFICCKNNNIEKDFNKIKNKVVFIEEHTKGMGIWNGNFGDVAMFNPDTKQKYKLTNDNYYDVDPHISPDENYLLFQSNRSSSKTDRIIRGISGFHNTYILDIITGTIIYVDIDYQKNLPEHMRTALSYMQWSKDSHHLFFEAYKNKIYTCTIKGDSVKLVKDFSRYEESKFTDMKDIIVSYDNNYIAFIYWVEQMNGNNLNIEGKGLAIYDIRNSKLRLLKIPHVFYVFCWSRDSRKVIIDSDDGLFTYDIYSEKTEMLIRNIKTIKFRRCKMINNNNYVLLAAQYDVKTIDGEEREIYKNNELAYYNVKEKRFEWLTSDGYEKDYLDVSTKANKVNR